MKSTTTGTAAAALHAGQRGEVALRLTEPRPQLRWRLQSRLHRSRCPQAMARRLDLPRLRRPLRHLQSWQHAGNCPGNNLEDLAIACQDMHEGSSNRSDTAMSGSTAAASGICHLELDARSTATYGTGHLAQQRKKKSMGDLAVGTFNVTSWRTLKTLVASNKLGGYRLLFHPRAQAQRSIQQQK